MNKKVFNFIKLGTIMLFLASCTANESKNASKSYVSDSMIPFVSENKDMQINYKLSMYYAYGETGTFTSSTTEDIPRFETLIVKKIDVKIRTAATPAVSFVIKVAALGPAKTLSLLELPKIPAAEPLPLCISTKQIKNKQARM